MRLPFGWMLFRMPKKGVLIARALVTFPVVGSEPCKEAAVTVMCVGGIESDRNQVCVKVALRFSDVLHAILHRQIDKGE